MTRSEKLAKIDEFERGGSAFDDTLAMEEKVLHFRPFPDAWTIHEQVVHFLESDIAAYHRYRRAVAEPGTKVLGFDEVVWTPALQYHTHDLAATIALLKALRSYAAAHLRSIADRDWSTLSYDHNFFGTVGLEAWLESYIDHVRFHRELIDRNLKLWAEKR
jgi:hypothetical protein